jgi:hypothetical protein
MPVYYHVVGPGFQEGEALVCWAQLYEVGFVEVYDWRWGDWELHDQGAVCLFRTLREAKQFAAEFGGRIARVTLDDEAPLKVGHGHPGVPGVIPAEQVELLPGYDYPYLEPPMPAVWGEYVMLDELPPYPEGDVTGVEVRVFEASDGLHYFCDDYGVNDCSMSDGYATAYRATTAAVEHYREKGERVTHLTHEACELGVPVRQQDGRFLVPTALLKTLAPAQVAGSGSGG